MLDELCVELRLLLLLELELEERLELDFFTIEIFFDEEVDLELDSSLCGDGPLGLMNGDSLACY